MPGKRKYGDAKGKTGKGGNHPPAQGGKNTQGGAGKGKGKDDKKKK